MEFFPLFFIELFAIQHGLPLFSSQLLILDAGPPKSAHIRIIHWIVYIQF